FSTMVPGVGRLSSTMFGAVVATVLAVTGAAGDLVKIFTIVGASFGPICGAMAADYLLSGRKWAGPRQGINFAGYGAWAAGFAVGLLPWQPAAVYSFIVGFVVYAVLAKIGLQPKPAEQAVSRAVA